jgi:hypothetical protein
MQRIEAHLCISSRAYAIYKEPERVLYREKSLKKASELTHNMYEILYTLPESKHTKSKLLKMDYEQADLYQIIQIFFLGCCKNENRTCFHARTRTVDRGR